MDKICSKCNISKPLTEFNKNKSKVDGYHVWCKKCISDNNKKLYNNNSEYKKNQMNLYYDKNKNTILPKLKEYRNKPEIKSKQADYIKTWIENNKEHYQQYQNKYAKDRRKNDNVFRTIENIKSQINHYLKDKIKNNKTEILLGYTYDDFINRLGSLCDDQEIDHKIPVSWFIKGTPIDIIWHLDNLQLTIKNYNKTKKNLFADSVHNEYYKIAQPWIKHHLLTIPTYL